MQQATFKETKSGECNFLVLWLLCGKTSKPISVCSLIILRGGFQALMQIVRSWPRRVTSHSLVSIFSVMPSLSNFILYVILITHPDNPALPLSINDMLRTPVIAPLPQYYLSPAFPTASEWVPCPTPWSERSSLLNIAPWGPVSLRWFGQLLCSWSSRWPRMSWPLLVSTHSSCSTGWSALLHLFLLAFSFQRPKERPSQSSALCTNRRWTHF